MGFLDNSGDIILDAVLTDLGRERLARGDGSFKITKFAVADDEIDYGKYDKNNPSGSAYYDLDILTTPVLEAFTNNIASVKHKLMTIPRNNLLYLPVIKLASAVDGQNAELWTGATVPVATNLYMITVDTDTSAAAVGTDSLSALDGVIRGDGADVSEFGLPSSQIVLDQGLDTLKIPKSFQLDSDLIENQYILEIDDRLGKIATPIQGGNANQVLAVAGADSSNALGNEIDLSLSNKYNANTTITAGFSNYSNTDLFRDLRNVSGGGANWAYLQFDVKF